MKRFIILAVMAVMTMGASAKGDKNGNDTLCVSTTPVMHCANCENKIKSNIRFVKGVKKIETSVPNQAVTIVYDKSKASYTDFEKAFKKIGFDISKKKQASSCCGKCQHAEGQGCQKPETQSCCKKAEGQSCCKK